MKQVQPMVDCIKRGEAFARAQQRSAMIGLDILGASAQQQMIDKALAEERQRQAARPSRGMQVAGAIMAVGVLGALGLFAYGNVRLWRWLYSRGARK